MYALVGYAISLSLVVAGFWLWDISVPAKLVGVGLTAAVLVFAYQPIEFLLGRVVTHLALIEARLRVIEHSLELQRLEPENRESATAAIAEQLEKESRTRGFLERVHPPWIDQLLGLAIGLLPVSRTPS